MKPIDFVYANKTLHGANTVQYSENVKDVAPLRVWTDGEQCVSCWKMSFKERLSALLFGRAWLAVLSGNSQPPVALTVARTYLEEVDD